MFFRGIARARKNMIYREGLSRLYPAGVGTSALARPSRAQLGRLAAVTATLDLLYVVRYHERNSRKAAPRWLYWAFSAALSSAKVLPILREVEQRIISESMLASRRVQNDAFRGAAENLKSLAVTGRPPAGR